MKSSMKLVLIGVLFVVGVAPMRATTPVAKTNYDLTIGFKLTSYVPGAKPGMALATRDIINGLSGTPYTNVMTVYTATNGGGVISNFFASPPAGWTTIRTFSTNVAKRLPLFSTTATMVFRQVLASSSVATSGVFVLEGKGTDATATDVSPWVTNGINASAVTIAGTKATAQTFDTFGVLQGAPAFIVTGVSTKTTGPSSPSGITVLNSLKAGVGGTGVRIFGTTTITSVISGTITYSGGHLE